MQIQLRGMKESDRPFVTSTWFKSHWKAVRKGVVDFENFAKIQRVAMDVLIAEVPTIIAFTPSAPDEILGYINATATTLNYLYVKKDFRRLGIGTKLLAGQKFRTHTSLGKGDWKHFHKARIPECEFNALAIPTLLARLADSFYATGVDDRRHETKLVF